MVVLCVISTCCSLRFLLSYLLCVATWHVARLYCTVAECVSLGVAGCLTLLLRSARALCVESTPDVQRYLDDDSGAVQNCVGAGPTEYVEGLLQLSAGSGWWFGSVCFLNNPLIVPVVLGCRRERLLAGYSCFSRTTMPQHTGQKVMGAGAIASPRYLTRGRAQRTLPWNPP